MTQPTFFKRVITGAFKDSDHAALMGVEFGQVLEPGELEREGIKTVEDLSVFIAVTAVAILVTAATQGCGVVEGDGKAANALFTTVMRDLPGRLHAAGLDFSDEEVCARVNAHREAQENQRAALSITRTDGNA